MQICCFAIVVVVSGKALRKVYSEWYLHCQDCWFCQKTNLIVDIQYNSIELSQNNVLVILSFLVPVSMKDNCVIDT